MAQKRRSGGRIRRPKELDYRCPDDDAWYSVRLYKAKEGMMRVMYREFEEDIDEEYVSEDFTTHEQLEDLVTRFRLPALQLQDSECGKVKEGMVVLVCYEFPGDELRFYDAIVDSVSASQHTKGEKGQEICTCKFSVIWREGPMRGEIVRVGAEHICLIQNLPIDDPILNGFFENVRKSLHGNYTERASSRRSNGVVSRTSPDEIKSRRVATPQSRFRGEISRGLESYETSDETENGSTENYFFWVDNITEDITPLSIIKFLKKEISVSAQVIMYPNLYKNCLSASIFVNNENDCNKLLSLLFKDKAIIVSSKGIPCIANEKCCGKYNYRMPRRLEMDNSVEEVEEGPGLRIIRPGSEGFDLAEKLVDLHKKFHEHIQGLQESLESEEMELRDSAVVIDID